nr:MAG: hypothetical protein [Guangxi cysto-like virus 1]
MTIYVIPVISTDERKQVIDEVTSSRIPVLTGPTVFSLISQLDPQGDALMEVNPSTMYLFSRYADHLLPELVVPILSIPGLVYDSNWLADATIFPYITYTEFVERLSKKGHTAHHNDSLAGVRKREGVDMPDASDEELAINLGEEM